jgi:hypothetical protein
MIKSINSIEFKNKIPLENLNLTKAKKKKKQGDPCYFKIDHKNLIERK